MGTLTAAKIKGINSVGKHGDGQGLNLIVAKGGTKSWIQRITIDGKRKEIGLGGFPAISLAKARDLSSGIRVAVAEGRDPLSEKHTVTRAIPTFREAAMKVHDQKAARFSSPKHTENWLQRLEKYAFPTLGDMPLDTIDRQDVLAILDPIWTTKTDTARRVREMMGLVFKWGMAYDYVQINLAGEIIDAALLSPAKRENHRQAMPYQDVPATLKTIRASTSSMAAKLALEFVILTAVRSSEVREATWGEIDLESRVWVIPAYRMKSRTYRQSTAIRRRYDSPGSRTGHQGRGVSIPFPRQRKWQYVRRNANEGSQNQRIGPANQRSRIQDQFQDVGAVDARRGSPGLRGIGPGPQDRE